MKKVFRIKLAGQRPITVIGDGYQVDGRTQLLQVFDVLGVVRSGESGSQTHIEPLFSAAGGHWEWVRAVSEVE